MLLLLIVCVMCFGLPLLGWLGYLANPEVDRYYSFVTYGTHLETSGVYLLLGLVCIFLGFYIREFSFSSTSISVYEIEQRENKVKRLKEWMEIYGLMLGIFLSFFFFFFKGWTFFPERTGYRTEVETSGLLNALSGVSGLLSIPALGAGFSVSKGKWRAFAVFVFFVLMLAFFAKASRIFAIAPLLFLGGAWLAGGKMKYPFIISLVFFPLLLSMALELRGLHIQGFLPFISYVFSEYSVNFLNALFRLYLNLGSSYFIFSETLVDTGWLSWGDMFVSINPLPGKMVGWYQVSDNYRIGSAVPYSAMGEAFGYSTLFGMLFCLLIGGLVSKINDNFLRLRYVGILQAVLLLYFCMLVPQYNLRSVMRFYYLIFFLGLARDFYSYLRVSVHTK